MVSIPQKYLFENSFDQPQGPIAVNFGRKPMEPTFSRAELDAARAAAMEEGRQAGLIEARASLEQRLADTVDRLSAGLDALLAREEEIRRETERQAIELLRTALAKALPELARAGPLAEIEAMIASSLAEVVDEPRIVLRVPNDLFDPLRQRLGAIAQRSGYAGKFVILAEDTLGPGDCRLEWSDGGAERNLRRLGQAIDAALTRTLAAATPKPESSRQESQDE